MTPRLFFRDVCILLGVSLVAGLAGYVMAPVNACAFPLLGLVVSIAMVCIFGRILFFAVLVCLLVLAFVPRRFTLLHEIPPVASVGAGVTLAFYMGYDMCASWPGLMVAMLVGTCIALHLVGILFWYAGQDGGGEP